MFTKNSKTVHPPIAPPPPKKKTNKQKTNASRARLIQYSVQN